MIPAIHNCQWLLVCRICLWVGSSVTQMSCLCPKCLEPEIFLCIFIPLQWNCWLHLACSDLLPLKQLDWEIWAWSPSLQDLFRWFIMSRAVILYHLTGDLSCVMSLPSHFILFYSILSYPILFYSILFYSILFYSILFYSILFYSILFYSILFYSILSYPILFYPILFYASISYSSLV